MVLFPEDARLELGVEVAQRRFDAEARIGLGDRGVVDRAVFGRCAYDGAAQFAEHLRVLQRDLDHFGEREVPIFGILRIQERDRRRSAERGIVAVERTLRLGRVLDRGGQRLEVLVGFALEVAVVAPLAAGGRNHRRGKHEHGEFSQAVHAESVA